MDKNAEDTGWKWSGKNEALTNVLLPAISRDQQKAASDGVEGTCLWLAEELLVAIVFQVPSTKKVNYICELDQVCVARFVIAACMQH